METLAIPSEYDEKTVLIADDEPEHLEWFVDFVENLGLKVVIAVNVEQAMAACQKSWYRIYVIDLNIPLGGWPQSARAMFASYPGFSIIQAIRSQGNDGRRVIAYSAHSNEQINAEMKRLYTDYIAKGRPIQLKDRVRELLAQPDQTAATLVRVRTHMGEKRKAGTVTRKTTPKPKLKGTETTGKPTTRAGKTNTKKTTSQTSRVKKSTNSRD